MNLDVLGSSWNLNGGSDEKGSIQTKTTGDHFFYPRYQNQNPIPSLPLPLTETTETQPKQPVLLPLPLTNSSLMDATHQRSSRPTLTPTRLSSNPRLSLPTSPSKSSLLLLLFLPFPPLFSLLFCFLGHAVLRMHDSYSNASLLSTVQAAATGGAILSVPMALLLYIFLFPEKRPDPEDFFEDDESQMTRARVQRYTKVSAYTACAFIGVFFGAIAGPLGVVCLGGSRLSPAQAAASGAIGGVVICGGAALLGAFGIGLWVVSMNEAVPQPDGN